MNDLSQFSPVWCSVASQCLKLKDLTIINNLIYLNYKLIIEKKEAAFYFEVFLLNRLGRHGLSLDIRGIKLNLKIFNDECFKIKMEVSVCWAT